MTDDAFEVRTADFVLSAARVEQVPSDSLPQIAFAGRSNVGKSSLLNTVCNRKGLAQVSGTPGRTRLLNVFRVNDAMYFVDLPGYGYARAPKEMKDDWGRLISNYLVGHPALRGVVALFDIRRELSEDDFELLNFLRHNRLQILAVLTKADKLSRMRQTQALRIFEKKLEPFDPLGCCLFSATARTGREELLNLVGTAAALPPR